MISTSHLLICALAILSFLLFVPPVSSRQNDYELKPFQIGKIFFWSADAPLTKELAKIPEVVKATDMVLQHFDKIEKAVLDSIRTARAPGPDDQVRPCNHMERGFGEAALRKMGVRGWPPPDVSCVTDIYGTEFSRTNNNHAPMSPFSSDQLYEAIYESGKAFSANVKPITRKLISKENNFTNPDIGWNFPYDTPSERCVLHPFAGWRVGDTWYTAFSVTNEPKSAQLRKLNRQAFSEYPTVVDGKLGKSMNMCLPVRPESGEVHENRTDATTLISSFRGNLNPSFVQAIAIDDNPAILRSLEKSDLFIQQAEDALTASSIVILFLPLFLNLVPIALLADVTTCTMLLYTLASDVLTVIPLGIKGIELISIGLQRHRSIMVRITGAVNGTRSQSAAAELFASECRAHENVLPAGIAFLVLSIVFLIGGIAAELLARWYAMKRREYRLEELKYAGLETSSNGTLKAASTSAGGSRQASQPPSLSSIDIPSQRTIGGPFRNGSARDTYQTRRRDKLA